MVRKLDSPKHVQLQQANLFDGLKGELRHRPAFGRARERHVFLQRIFRHHQSGGVG